jgi:hypothetical protein
VDPSGRRDLASGERRRYLDRVRCRWIGVVAGIALGFAAGGSRSARAEYWSYEEDDVETRASALLRFSSRADLWFSTYSRPVRACDPSQFGIFGTPPLNNGFAGLCNNAHSDETGIGTGIEAAFRVVRPIYVFAGIDLVYTFPNHRGLKNQIVIPAPFGILITFHEWTVRPIARATITPLVYLTDDARDYTLGGDLGFAWRVLDWGDLSFTLGYKTAATIKSWQLEVAIHPVP